MTINYTTLLGLAKPVTGTEASTWGTVVNDEITSLLDTAIAGTTTLTADTTLSTTTGAANQSRQAILLCSPASTNITITAPAQSKIYTVINTSATYTVTIRGVGPTTGVTLAVSESAVVAWNGTDFIRISSNSATTGNFTVNGNLTVTGTSALNGITTLGAALVGPASATVFNTVSTTVNAFGAATTLNFGAATGTLTVANTTLAAKAITASTTLSVTGVTTVQAGTAALPAITTTGDTNTGIFFPAADTVGVSTGGSERARVDSSGNVGIGVTPSAWSSGKAIEIGSLGNAFWNNGASENHLTTNAYYNVGWKFGGTGYAQKLTTNSGQYQFNVSTASGTAGNAITFTQAMTLDASGNLGIGTSSPSGKLHVAGGANSNDLLTSSTGTTYLIMGNVDGGANAKYSYVGAASQYLLFGKVNDDLATRTEYMRIDNSGNLIPATSVSQALGSTTWRWSTVYAAAFADGADQLVGSTSTTTRFGAGSGWTTLNLFTGGTTRLSINSSGNVGIGTTSPANWLDISANTSSTVGHISLNTTSVSNAIRMFYRESGTAVAQIGWSVDGNALELVTAKASSQMIFYTVNTERMRIDSSGNVGIGTSSPSANLSVFMGTTAPQDRLWTQSVNMIQIGESGARPLAGLFGVRSTYAGASPYNGDLAFYNLWYPGSGDYQWKERMRIDSAGNVGIGVTPSAWLSTVKAIQLSNRASIYTDSSGNTIVGNNSFVNSSSQDIYLQTAQASAYLQGAGQHKWYNAPSGTAGNAITYTQAMTLDASGKLLLNCTSGTGLSNGDFAMGNNNHIRFRNAADSAYISAFQFTTANGLAIGSGGALSTITFGISGLGDAIKMDTAGNLQMSFGAVMPYAPAPQSISAATTLTNANIQGQIISATGTTYTITMPLGSTLETLATWATTNIAYDFFVINTASGTVTMAVNTNVTSLGTLTIATGVSAQFRIRRTAANTFVLYRLG